MLVHRRSFPRNLLGFPNNSPVPIYRPWWRDALWELSVFPKIGTIHDVPSQGSNPDRSTWGLADERTNHEASRPAATKKHSTAWLAQNRYWPQSRFSLVDRQLDHSTLQANNTKWFFEWLIPTKTIKQMQRQNARSQRQRENFNKFKFKQ